MVAILNTSILTNFGEYEYSPISLTEAQELVKKGFRSAIGHESTAAIISTLLGIECPVNRMLYRQQEGENALIFKLKERSPEGKILSTEEIEKIGYTWGLLTRKITLEKIFQMEFPSLADMRAYFKSREINREDMVYSREGDPENGELLDVIYYKLKRNEKTEKIVKRRMK